MAVTWARGALLHDRIQVGRAPADLASERVNAVLVRRPALAAQHAARAAELARQIARDAAGARTVQVGRPVALPVVKGAYGGGGSGHDSSSSSSTETAAATAAAAAEELVAALTARDEALAALIAADALELASTLAAALAPRRDGRGGSGGGWWSGSRAAPLSSRPPPPLRAKLEVITAQTCPNWHADTVGARALITYAGAGTWFVPNSAARRKWALDGTAAVAGVDESAAVQAAPFDCLYLKGGAAAGMHGTGAVHKSPAAQEPRLLLTVDDVPLCACC